MMERVKEIETNRNNKEMLIKDYVTLNRYDEFVETISFNGVDVIRNDNNTLQEFYEFIKEIIYKYDLDIDINEKEQFLIDRIYGNCINNEQVVYFLISDFLFDKIKSD